MAVLQLPRGDTIALFVWELRCLIQLGQGFAAYKSPKDATVSLGLI